MAIALAENERTAENAAIKRATFAAHKSVEKLDAQSAAELETIYQRAAADIAERIRLHAGPDDNLTLVELRSALAQVEARLQELGRARDALLDASLRQAAELGVRPYVAAAAGAAIAHDAGMRISNEALEFVRTFVAQDGLQLSDRIWRLDRGARDQVVNAIEQAVIQGHGARQAALELLGRGQAVPADIAAKMNAANAGALGSTVKDALMKDEGSPMDNAMRLMRTEINRAHGEAFMKGGEDVMGFAGWRYLLSPAHPKPDICDLLSTQNLYGLGKGVYPTRERTPWPAHPNTLSFVETVFDDEITDADRAGKETPLQALARLKPEQRVGVLGKKKNEYYNEGRMTQGMIRTPLKQVRQRLDRARTPGIIATPIDTRKAIRTPVTSAQAVKVEQAARTPWGEFPEALIHRPVAEVKRHPQYAAAKAGDVSAAQRLVDALLVPQVIARMGAALRGRQAILAPVFAEEELGINRIPAVMAEALESRLPGVWLGTQIVQVNRVGHTGASGWARIAHPPLFEGAVEKGGAYVIVDDFVGQGGTIANLRGHIESNGGRVLFGTTLTGQAYSARLTPGPDTLAALRAKHGNALEDWLRETFGYGFDRLTESEARYLTRAESLDVIRNRIAQARSGRDR